MIHVLTTVPKSSGFCELLCSCPCHHSMAHPQVVDGGRASNMKGRCEYIDKAVSRGQLTRGGRPVWGLGKVLTTPHRKNISCYVIFKQE